MADTIRHPRCWISIGGKQMPCMDATVTRTSRRQSDSFTADLAIGGANGTERYGYGYPEWVDYQPQDVSIIMATDASGSDQQVMVTGLVDNPTVHWAEGTVSLSGRDKSSAAIERRVSKKYLNRKASDIVQEVASDLGLSSAVVDTSDHAGKVYQDDTTHLHIHRTYFELLSSLADREGYRWYVDGSTLYFEPKEMIDGVFSAWWYPPGARGASAVSNLLDLETMRNMTAAKPHSVSVKSWHHHDARLYSGQAAASGVGNEIVIEHHHNDHTQSQVDKISRSRLKDAIRHECNVVAKAPADLSVTPRMKFQLSGTGTMFDQTFDIDTVHFDFGWDTDFTMDIEAKAPKAGRST